MYPSYTLYQAERVKTVSEQRADDVRTGQLAAAFAQLWHSPRRHRAARSAAARPASPSLNLANDHRQCVTAKL